MRKGKRRQRDMRAKKKASKLGVSVLTAATLMASLRTVPAMAATNEQTIGIKGTVSAISTLDVTVPVQPLEFTINNEGTFSSEAKSITNHTAVPVYAYLTEVYGSSGDYPALVSANAYGDWSGLDHDATIARMALQINGNELSTIYKTDSSTKSDTSAYIALGSIDADTGTLGMQLTGNSGKAWNNATDVEFAYKANMLFTTIEGNFGNGSNSGSGSSSGGSTTIQFTEYINSNYADYAQTAEAAGYTTLTYNTDFTFSGSGKPDADKITINYIGYKVDGDNVELYTSFTTGYETEVSTFGAGAGTYNNYANHKTYDPDNNIDFKETITKENIQKCITDGGLNIRYGSQGQVFFASINTATLGNMVN